DTAPRNVVCRVSTHLTGIRLRPGAAGAVLGIPASELRDRHLPVSLVWGEQGERLEDAMAGAEPRKRLVLLAEAVARRGAEPDALVLAAADMLSMPRARVADVAADLGVSERQLHRRLVAAVGYGPKVLARVARLQQLAGLAGRSMV